MSHQRRGRRRGVRRRLWIAVLVATGLTCTTVAMSRPVSAGSGGDVESRSSQAPSTVSSTLDHRGRWIVDGRDRVVVLHGMNAIDTEPPYDLTHRGFGADDIGLIRAAGFNTLRIGPIWAAAEPSPGSYDDRYLDRLIALARRLNTNGIRPLIDFHQDGYLHDGAPAWATQTDGLPQCVDPIPVVPCDTSRAFDHFWANDPGPYGVGLQKRYAEYVAHVVKRFTAADVRLVGYDLMNEPIAGSQSVTCASPQGCPVFDKETLAPFYRRVIDRVRRVNPTALLFYEPQYIFDSGAQSSIPDLGDAHLGFSFHPYCLAFNIDKATGTEVSQSGPACELLESRVVDNALSQSSANGDALLMTEFGSTSDLTRQRHVMSEADRLMFGWMEWSYWNPENPRDWMLVHDLRRPPSGRNLNETKLRVLARPYPRLVSGTPTSWTADPRSGRFTLRYSTRKADGRSHFPQGARTQIAVPGRWYPDGYHVQLSGARVVKRRGSILQIASTTRRGPVQVLLTRR